MTDQPEGVWIDYKPGDPVPAVPVRIRLYNGWTSDVYAHDWLSWGYGVAYMIAPGTARERLRDAAPDLLEACHQLGFGVGAPRRGLGRFARRAYRGRPGKSPFALGRVLWEARIRTPWPKHAAAPDLTAEHHLCIAQARAALTALGDRT